MVTLTVLGRLAELEERLGDLGLERYRDAVDEALRALGSPAYRFLRTGEAAQALGVSIPTVKRWGRRGILPIQRVRGRWLVPAESVESLKTHVRISDAREELDAPLPREHQRRMLTLGRKANRGTLTAEERAEYQSLIRLSEERASRLASAAAASRGAHASPDSA